MSDQTQHVVSVGGGIASTWKLPEYVVSKYGPENVHLVMAKLPNEDPDVWRLCDAVEERLGVKITYIGDNLTPWDVFFKVRMMGSSRLDPCSRILKREALQKWISDRFSPENTIRYIGFTYDEIGRWIEYKTRMAAVGWEIAAPLLDDPNITRASMMQECQDTFGFIPRLYKYGFSHNNCGGACIKAGHKEWARLLRYIPDVYQWWEENEQRFMREIGTVHTILRDRSQGVSYPLSLEDFRERMEFKWALESRKDQLFTGLEDSPACAFCEAS